MKTRLKFASSLAIFVVGLGALSQFFNWMNQPSDGWLYAGIAGVLVLLVLVPGAIAMIWRSTTIQGKRP